MLFRSFSTYKTTAQKPPKKRKILKKVNMVKIVVVGGGYVGA
ncbi:MAG: hypothetical protein ACI90V_008003, partial [Bacillariaceae sp.]